MSSTFDLEKAVDTWRRQLEHRRSFMKEDLDELERHLRDHHAVLVHREVPPEEAFTSALQEIGAFDEAESEYSKVYWGKLRQRRSVIHELTHSLAMLKNYLVVLVRNLKKHPGYTAINVVGLAVGLASCIVISLYVADETSYDTFNVNADRIYRVERMFKDGTKNAFVSGPVIPALKDEVSGIEAGSRLHRVEQLVRHGDRQFFGEKIAYVDPDFLRIFTFPLIEGDSSRALTTPNGIVLTRSMAQRYFGDEDPVGETLTLDNQAEFVVTGVIVDVPAQSHLRFDALAPMSRAIGSNPWIDNWGAIGVRAYVLLSPGTTFDAFMERSRAFDETHYGADAKQSVWLRPLEEIHLQSDAWEIDPQGDIETIYLFSAIALFILLLACINYMNLATARATRRAREVGMRKVMGAVRWQLVRQFLGESVLTTLVALALGLLLAWLVLPLLGAFLGRSLSFDLIGHPKGLALLAGVTLLVGVVAGLYPAVVLTRFRPVAVLKGAQQQGRSGNMLRKGLVVAQFAVSIALLVSTVFVVLQLRFIQNKDLGFTKEHVLDIFLHDHALVDRAELLKNELRKDPQVIDASLSSTGVDEVYYSTNVGPAVSGDEQATRAMTNFVFVDPAFIPTMGMTIVAGRNFLPGTGESADDGVILNEAAVRTYGWESPQEAIGKNVASQGFGTDTPIVVGVVRDYNFRSLRQGVPPVIMVDAPAPKDGIVSVRLQPGNAGQATERFAAVWKNIYPNWPFDFTFLDQELQQRYARVQQRGNLFSAFAALAVLIACMGLFGLAAYSAEQRTKEIGVRKVMGASVPQIIGLMSREFTVLVAIAFVVAAPLAYFFTSGWLEGFVYRIDLSWWVFVATGVAALLIAWITVSYQAMKAALVDPVKALRYE